MTPRALPGSMASRPHDHRNPGDTYPAEARSIDGAPASPPPRAHHAPHLRLRAWRAILPAARDPASRHKQPRRHAHDAYWRRRKEG
jgi:hypothetical protein